MQPPSDNPKPESASRTPRSPHAAARASLAAFLVLIGLAICVKSFIDTDFSLDLFKHTETRVDPATGKSEFVKVWGMSEMTRNALAKIARPSFEPELLRKLAADMWLTVEISLAGTILALFLCFPMAFLGANNLMRGSPAARTVYIAVRFLFSVSRAFPPILLALLFVLVVGVGPFAGVLALALHSVGALGQLFSEAIENIDKGQVEAVEAVGAHPVQVVWYGVLPQVLPRLVTLSIYRWDMNIRMSMIIGIVGAGGIGFMLDQYIKQFRFSEASTAFLIILAASFILDQVSAWLRTRFD
ncbi:MAG: phosphonate ABC transporter, permease protein PhnE [bacterium]|jgi:phosphonate transport system permease protein